MKAKELDPDNPGVYLPIAIYAVDHDDLAGAQRANEAALSLQPKSPFAYANLAEVFFLEGQPRRSIELRTQAINLDPKHVNEVLLNDIGESYFMLGDNDAAIEWFLKASEKNPASAWNFAYLAMAYALQGEDANARAAAADVHRLDPDWTLSAWRKKDSSKPPKYKEWFESKVVPAWRKAGLPE